jgi:hypothetical protein
MTVTPHPPTPSPSRGEGEKVLAASRILLPLSRGQGEVGWAIGPRLGPTAQSAWVGG